MLRSFAGLDGMTTRDVAALCAMTEDGARKMMCNLSASHGVPIYCDGGRWQLNGSAKPIRNDPCP